MRGERLLRLSQNDLFKFGCAAANALAGVPACTFITLEAVFTVPPAPETAPAGSEIETFDAEVGDTVSVYVVPLPVIVVAVPFTTVTSAMVNCVTGWENVITTENAPETGVVGPAITACKAAARVTVTV